MTNESKRKKAYRYIADRLGALPIPRPNDTVLCIPLDDLRLLKEGAADPSYALVSAVKTLLAEHVPEGEIEKNLDFPFRKTRKVKEASPVPSQKEIKKVMIIGSGPIVIGQACEFDYSGTQACKALRSLGYKIVLVNSNPATIMTDPGMADSTYIEPLNVESMIKIIEKERPDAILPNLGGQTGLNLSSALAESGALEEVRCSCNRC